jgi:acetyl-CoA C-acetyltransferase
VSPAAPAAAGIIGAFEHPERRIPHGTVADVITDVSLGALEDAGLGLEDVDGFFFAGVHQGLSLVAMADHLGLDRLTHVDSTDIGGASTLSQVAHAALAIAAGRCRVALIAMGGRPLAASSRPGSPAEAGARYQQDVDLSQIAAYALVAQRHMYEYGTTREQLAMVKVIASQHAQHNPHARLPRPVTTEEVLDSPLISDPLRRLDCCVTTDGGGALVLAAPEVVAASGRAAAWVRGGGETLRTMSHGYVDLMRNGAERSGAAAFEQAGVGPGDISYASLYDSFTITVLLALEALGFCEPGRSGGFVADGGILAGTGSLPVNTDGGGLCNNHPDRRGGMARTLEAVRQVRGEAAAAVQVDDCELALVNGTGHSLGGNASAATLVLGKERS